MRKFAVLLFAVVLIAVASLAAVAFAAVPILRATTAHSATHRLLSQPIPGQ